MKKNKIKKENINKILLIGCIVLIILLISCYIFITTFTSSSLLGKNNKYKNYIFRKVNISNLGSTRRENETINGHDVVWIGNRSLVKIDGILYKYYKIGF